MVSCTYFWPECSAHENNFQSASDQVLSLRKMLNAQVCQKQKDSYSEAVQRKIQTAEARLKQCETQPSLKFSFMQMTAPM